MIDRDLAGELARCAEQYPCVLVTGPRQSGKTTLCRAQYPEKPYVSLEPLDTRAFAREDPRGFLARYAGGAIFDEIQRVPELLGYLQEGVDADPIAGRFVLTGSQQLALDAAVSQSLAGRVAVLHLLPPSRAELLRFAAAPTDLWETLLAGSYPRIFDRGIPATRWLRDYVATYVQRDVRQALNVSDLAAFTTFLRLCAGSSGQELNLARLGADAGISQPTARAWLSVLEASFICWRLPAWHARVRKRLIRAPKLHFWDTGLLCHLLGIDDVTQLHRHPLRGAIFETWVASELIKQRLHRGEVPRAFHYRESAGIEVDMLLVDAGAATLIEMKSGATVHGQLLTPLLRATAALADAHPELTWQQALVYGGEASGRRQGVRQVAWREVTTLSSSG